MMFVIELLNYIFTAIFAVEVFIKIVGQGFTVFFRESWNTFDFVVAITSALSIVISS